MQERYFNRDEEIEPYLKRYNDEFPDREAFKERFYVATSFIRDCCFDLSSRFSKKADFFTAFVEFDYFLNVKRAPLNPALVCDGLEVLYNLVDGLPSNIISTSDLTYFTNVTQADPKDVLRYARAALQATNDRSSRVTRGTVVRKLLSSVSVGASLTNEGPTSEQT